MNPTEKKKGAITYNEFVSVVINLLRSGENPTYEAIIKGLGGRGSKSTIKKFKTTWQESLKEADTDILPPHLPESLIKPLEGFFNAAVAIAEETYDVHKKKCDERVELAELEVKEARRELSNLDSQIVAFEESELRSSMHIEQLERELSNNKKHYDELVSRLEKSISKTEQEKQSIQHEKESALKLLSLDHAKDIALMNDNMAKAQTNWNEKHSELVVKISELEAQLNISKTAFDDERERSVKEIDHWMLKYDNARTKIDSVREGYKSEISKIKAELDLACRREDRGSQRNGQLEVRVDNLMLANEKLQTSLIRVQKENSDLLSTVSNLKSSN